MTTSSDIRNVKLKSINGILPLIIFMLIGSTNLCFSQWTFPGIATTIQGVDGPEIEGNNAWLELTGTNNASSLMGLKFSNNSGAGQVTEAFLHYNMGTNQLHFSPDGFPSSSVFRVDVDNGNTEIGGELDITGPNTALRVDGDEAIWYNGTSFSWGFAGVWNRFARPITIGGSVQPPTGTALVTTGGQKIKMVGNNANIQWHTATNTDPNGPISGYIGSDQVGATNVVSSLDYVVLNGQKGIAFEAANLPRMYMDDAGNLGIGTAMPAYKLQVFGDADITGELTAASDARLKKDVSKIENALQTVTSLNPVSYNFKTSEFSEMKLPEGEKMGFIAQEIEKHLPQLVSEGAEITDANGKAFNCKSVNYVELIPMLTKAIQEQQEIITQQSASIASLKSEMASMKAMVSDKKDNDKMEGVSKE